MGPFGLDALRSRLLTPRAVLHAVSAQFGMEAEVHPLLDIDIEEDKNNLGYIADVREHTPVSRPFRWRSLS